jgi:hypothetical protein
MAEPDPRAKFINAILEEFGADGPPCFDLATLPQFQFEDMLEEIERQTGYAIIDPRTVVTHCEFPPKPCTCPHGG